MNRLFSNTITLSITAMALFHAVSAAHAGPVTNTAEPLKQESPRSTSAMLEELIIKSSLYETVEGFASYYANRFKGHRTTSGHRYDPDKLTAAHESLPIGTVVRVLNPDTKQEVHVTITDRCASKAYHFIDLSRAAAKKIGLWGKGKIKVVIFPLLEEKLEEPA